MVYWFKMTSIFFTFLWMQPAILNFSLEYFRKCYQWRPRHNAYDLSLQMMLFWSYTERNKDTDTVAIWPSAPPLPSPLASGDDKMDLKGGLLHLKVSTGEKHWHLQSVQQIAIFICCGTLIKILEKFFNPTLFASKLKYNSLSRRASKLTGTASILLSFWMFTVFI